MKKAKIYLPIILLGLFITFISGCTTTPTESCVQDEICAQTVTSCCSDTGCYYEYNGVQYGDDEESQAKLAAALGCVQASDPNYKVEIDNIILRLEALSEIARTQSATN